MIEKAKPIAAHMLEATPTTWSSPAAGSASGAPTRGSALGELALAVFAAHNLPDGVEPTLDSDATFDPDELLLPARHPPVRDRGRHRDRGDPIRKYVCVDDIGKVVNPMIVEGQVHGGLAQGIAQALFEEAVYDEPAR